MDGFVPVRFKRVTTAFDGMAKVSLCQSSGSEHSSVTDLSGLVNLFLEGRNGFCGEVDDDDDDDYDQGEKEGNGNDCLDDSHSDIRGSLRKLLSCCEESNGFGGDDDVNRNVRVVVENAWLEIGDRSLPDFKRQLMTQLRDRGFDAGLCKSKWERSGQRPPGNYEYIDVNVNENRYIIEVCLGREFEIARPTACYASLLEIFPSIFVGKVVELKQVVKIMSKAMKKSMKKMDIHLPPWRRFEYMQAKWFGSYKRTINEFSDDQKSCDYDYLAKKRAVGLVPMPAISFYCRVNFASNNGIKMGNLAATLNG